MLEQVLDMIKPLAEQGEVYELVEETTPVSFEANRLKEIQTKQIHGLAIRVLRNGRVGLASTTDWRDLASVVNRAVAATAFGAEARFQLPSYVRPIEVAVYDPNLASLSTEKMMSIGQEMIDRVRNYDSDILCSARISKKVSMIALANTEGGRASYLKTVQSTELEGNLTRATDILTIVEEASSCRADLNVERLVADLVNKFDMARREATVATKSMPVIFTPKGAANAFHLPLQLAFNSKVVLQGASPLGDKVGQTLFDPRISIFDDGTVDFAPRSSVVDDEGVPTQRTALVESGRIQGFLYDLQTAGLAGKRSTGNGFRTLETLPSPAFTSLIFAEGDTLLPDMIADVKEGVLVDQVMGAWVGNLLAGELSGNVHLGFKIENGILVGRVKDTVVAGNVYEALGKGLAAVGSEATWVDGAVFIPPLYFKELSVATKS